ncbi:hypothetical protein [Cyanothece sp. BG0011]|nr:hypothetical protein [Cyanothece sp. BG0011]
MSIKAKFTAQTQVAIAVDDGALAGTQIWRDLRRIEGARPNLDNLPVSV